jgi:AraC-like DNA-binding protein
LYLVPQRSVLHYEAIILHFRASAGPDLINRINLVRTGLLASYVDLARSLQLDPFHLLKGVGLDRVDLSDSDALIPAAATAELLERSAEAAGLEDFGLRLARMRTLAQVGPVGLLVREEPTVGHAIQVAERYFRARNDALSFRLDEYEETTVLRIRLLSITEGRTRQATELIVGTVFRVLNALTGSAWAPESVGFSHPPPTGRTVHNAFFRTRTLFGTGFDGFVLRQSDLTAAIRTADTAMPQYIKHYVEQVSPQPVATTDATVRHLVFALLPTGRCSSELIANHLGVDRTTINRRLALRGETFSSIVNSVRIELARRYIQTERRSLTETAQLLGFSGLATFSRWFRTEFGTSATSWRKHRDAPAASNKTAKLRLTMAARSPRSHRPV